jgi:hypothetical protein
MFGRDFLNANLEIGSSLEFKCLHLNRDYSVLLFRIALKISEVKKTAAEHKTTTKIIEYLNREYGSLLGFKLLKYFLEHKLAREKHG